VEIREIIPPREVQEAMNRQMTAERNRRAVVTEAEGKREAAVTVATGEKQAAILASEGARQSAILRAEGQAQALETVFSVAQAVDPKTMSLQYLETLKVLGSGQATKIVIPMEFTQLLQPLLNLAGAAGGPQTPPATPTPSLTVSETNGHAPAVAAPTRASIGPPATGEPSDAETGGQAGTVG
jgi:hypothetical protein